MESFQNRHLKYFKIENFKDLRSFELSEIKRFNLILGDNNIGKTSLLESLLFDELPYNTLRGLNFLYEFKTSTFNRDAEYDYLDFFFGFLGSSIRYNYQYDSDQEIRESRLSRIEATSLSPSEVENLVKNTLVNLNQMPKKIISVTQENGIENFYTYNYNLHRNKNESGYFPFIRSGITYQNDLVEFFSVTVNNNIALKREFISALQLLVDDIYDLTIDVTTISEPTLMVLFKSEKTPIPLFMMGDGTIRLVRILLEVILCKNSRLMIDEIDNGFHFSKMKSIWKIVINIAILHNTQLFISTHDAECLRAFKDAIEENELEMLQDEVACFTLFRDKKDMVNSVRYNFTEFEHAIDHSLNVRG